MSDEGHGGHDSDITGGVEPLGSDMSSHHDSDHGSFFPSLVNGEDEQQLLEMLHVPLLHGGVKEVILLTSLSTSSTASFTFACAILALVTGALELLRLLLWWVEEYYTTGGRHRQNTSTCDCKHCSSLTTSIRGATEHRTYDAIHESGTPPVSVTDVVPSEPTVSKECLCWAGIGLLQLLTYLMGTLLMLVAMTMNIYLIISMGFGAALGRMTVVFIRKRLIEKCK